MNVPLCYGELLDAVEKMQAELSCIRAMLIAVERRIGQIERILVADVPTRASDIYGTPTGKVND